MGNAMRRRAAQVTATVLLTVILVVLPGADAALAAAPTISSFSPASGPVGTSVTIHGHNFSGPNVTSVTFNGTSATFTIDNAQKITATVPSGATTGPIAVTSPDGTATSSTNFTVTGDRSSDDHVVQPDQRSGRDLGPDQRDELHRSDRRPLQRRFGDHLHGAERHTYQRHGPLRGDHRRITVTPSGTATSSTNFTVTTTGAPTITSFNPTSGPVGTSVQINGTNFTGATAVRFNGVSATTFTVVNATRINATVPSGATTGRITVTTPSGTATSEISRSPGPVRSTTGPCHCRFRDTSRSPAT